MNGRVFVSSTCYDLLDLRAELEVHIRELGLIPVMSDRPTSDFSIVPDQNSIQTCLVNVRDCDEFVCILSQRYGPPLGKLGFADVSATHLEYLEAKQSSKPIRFFIRDRAAADYSSWKRNGRLASFKGAWVKDAGLYDLIAEHEALSNRPVGNWYWSFSSSVDLRARLTVELGGVSRQAVLRKLIQDGRLPTMALEARRRTGTLAAGLHCEMWITTLDRPILECSSPGALGLGPYNLVHGKWELLGQLSAQAATLTHSWQVPVEYVAETGHRVRDTYVVVHDSTKGTHAESTTLKSRELLGEGYSVL